MKKILMIIALCVGVTSVSIAQDRQGKGAHRNMTPEQRAEKQTNKMQEALSLTDAQKKAIYDLNLQSAKEIQAIRQESNTADKEKVKEIKMKKEEKMKTILTAEQLTKYEALKAERKENKKERKGVQDATEQRQDK